jgi:glycosyltransferase involved in cell wall biosynthesis
MILGLLNNVAPPKLELLERLVDGQNGAPCQLRDERADGAGMLRPRVEGKFLLLGDEKFWVRGVTYGTFCPDEAGNQYPPREIVEDDFKKMVRVGLNSIRVYTIPPRWLLDLAAAQGLRVMVGVPWEQHTTFLDGRTRSRDIVQHVRDGIRKCARHPAVLCYAIGNEIPAAVVRWHGKRWIEAFLTELCHAARTEDPTALVTYVNFPTTEYLDLSFVDFACFNVYLESKQKLSSYLARLQNIAGERPLLMAELGLDSRRNGEAAQAESLDWQIATAFEAGCVGAFVFSWTDKWFRGGHDIEDWDFGLTTRDRQPKKALATVAARFAELPFATTRTWPKISVVVCSYNGSATIGQTLAALERLDYPDYEIIVIDDGSTDTTSAIALKHNVRLIKTTNNGLSAARNLGMNEATGEIVAYIDDDAYPDPHWLKYLASNLIQSERHAGIGGPNIAPPGDGPIADCIANAPGGPVHVLLSDEIAEHIPGCNMAYWRDRLLAIGGFDPRFRVAGDDVDVCWRLQDRGWTLGFAPTAVVWHHRRNSVRAYFKQQMGYARAEALLAQKWPAKYNSAGHLTWQGRLYGKGVVASLFPRPRIYHGIWGGAPFQSVYERAPGLFSSLPLMPEWYFLLLVLWFCSGLGFSWAPLFWVSPVAIAALGLTVVQAACGGGRASFHPESCSNARRLGLQLLVIWLHLLQPAARVFGRIRHGLGPWSWRGFVVVFPGMSVTNLWSERWEATETRLAKIEQILHTAGAAVVRGGSFDAWDLMLRGGLFGAVRTVAAVEEHAEGKQLIRLRAWPKVPAPAIGLILATITLAGFAAVDHAWVAAFSLAATAIALIFLTYADCAIAMKRWRNAVEQYLDQDQNLSELSRSSDPGKRSVRRLFNSWPGAGGARRIAR